MNVRIRDRVLERLATFACGRPLLVLTVAGLITVFSVAVIVVRGKVSTDLADVLPPNSQEAKLYLEVGEHFAADMLIIAVESDDAAQVEAAKPFVDKLAQRLLTLQDTYAHADGKTNFIKSVDYRVGEELKRFLSEIAEERGYLFLDADARAALAAKLTSEAIDKQMAVNRQRYEAAGADYFRQRIVPDPLDLVAILQSRRAQINGQFKPKEGEAYFISPDGTLMLMLVQATGPARDLSFDKRLMAAIVKAQDDTWDELLEEDREKFAAVREAVSVSHTGGYAVALTDNQVLSEDLGASFLTSLVGVLLVFAIGFGRFRSMGYIGIPLVASVVWTLAVAFLGFGHVSVMSGGFAAILVGLSVDYAIHVYNFYISARARGDDVMQAAKGAVTISGSGIFFSSLTSAVAFFAIMLTSFVGLSEFGLLAGVGVLLGMAAMLLVLPAMLVARSRMKAESPEPLRVFGFGLDHLADLVVKRPWGVTLFSAALSIAAVVFVYTTMTKYFFNSDFRSLRADSPVYDLAERVQRKFGTTLGGIFVMSRGETSDEAIANAYEVRQRARAMQTGRVLTHADWSGSDAGPFHPSISIEGTTARIRRAEIVLPEGMDIKLPEGAEILTRPDGTRLVIYKFMSAAELADWEIEGDGSFLGGVQLRPGATATWKHAVGAEADFTFSVWLIGTVSSATLAIDADRRVTAEAGPRGQKRAMWPPHDDDMTRFTFTSSVSEGIDLVVGRGTIAAMDSVTNYIPPLALQKSSAAFVAAIDVDRITADIETYAPAHGLKARAFQRFVRQLSEMVERASEPTYLTIEEIEGGQFSALLKRYHAPDEEAQGVYRHTVATYLYPEQGELPKAWYQRVRDELLPAGMLSAPRLVSLEVRDIVHKDFSMITVIVVVGVCVSLLWSFRSIGWSLASLLPVVSGVALMLATLLLVKHQLNFVNVLIFPIIVGIGIDYGIHVVHRHLDGASVRNIITETGRAFVLTSLTTMVGFGSLMISRYKGLVSLGFVSILGILFCLYFSLVALPALLVLVGRKTGAAQDGESTPG
jgi:predicted RND superfamily exporter protein